VSQNPLNKSEREWLQASNLICLIAEGVDAVPILAPPAAPPALVPFADEEEEDDIRVPQEEQQRPIDVRIPQPELVRQPVEKLVPDVVLVSQPEQEDDSPVQPEEVGQDISPIIEKQQQQPTPVRDEESIRPQKEEEEVYENDSSSNQQNIELIQQEQKEQITGQKVPSTRPLFSSNGFQLREPERQPSLTSSSSNGFNRPVRPRPAILQEPASDFFIKNFPDAAAPEGDDVPLDEQAAIREALFELKKETKRSG